MAGMCELLHTGDVFWPSSVEPHREEPMVRIHLPPPASQAHGARIRLYRGSFLTQNLMRERCRAAIPASPRIRSATSEKAASSGETRRRVRVGLSARGRSKAKPDSILSTNGQQSVSALLGYRVLFAPE